MGRNLDEDDLWSVFLFFGGAGTVFCLWLLMSDQCAVQETHAQALGERGGGVTIELYESAEDYYERNSRGEM